MTPFMMLMIRLAAFEACLEDVAMMDLLSEYNAEAVKDDHGQHEDAHGAESMIEIDASTEHQGGQTVPLRPERTGH